MKNIEEINNSRLRKLSLKKHPEFFPGDIVKVGVKITEEKGTEFNILRVFVLLKKIEI